MAFIPGQLEPEHGRVKSGRRIEVSRENLEGLYGRVSEQARNQYTIGYSGAHADRSKPYHTIEVRVKRPGLSLLTRDGYYLNLTP